MRQIGELKSHPRPESFRVLYLASYAPDFPDFAVKPFEGDGGYPQYHYNIYAALKDLGYQVFSASKPYAIQHARGNVDYVFSLLNRMPISNSEIFISSFCEFARIPYLGARPNIRALAEDKYLTKLSAQSLNIPVPTGLPHSKGTPLPTEPPFSGPYFIKDRFGAASEGISEANICGDWGDACDRARQMAETFGDILIEKFCPGIDVTVVVLGGITPMVLGFVQPNSDKNGNILTEDLRLTDYLGYQIVDVGQMESLFLKDVDAVWRAFGPIDYFRVDYRVDFETNRRWLLEINICCHIGKSGAICLAARQHGLSQLDLLRHITAFSLERQQVSGQQREWIL